MTRKLFVTTALPYANGPFHIGHIMEYIQADIWVRFQRMLGNVVHFVCADEMHDISEHPLEADPDVGLDVFHDMPDVERAVGVGQGGGDEEFAGHPHSLQRAAAFRRRDQAPAIAEIATITGVTT